MVAAAAVVVATGVAEVVMTASVVVTATAVDDATAGVAVAGMLTAGMDDGAGGAANEPAMHRTCKDGC